MPAVPALLSSPEIAFVLLAVAVLGVVLEIAVPGIGLGALAAVGLIGLASWALTDLSPRPGGVLLTVLAAGLLVAGVFLPVRALWGIAGGVALLLAGLTLFEQRPAPALVLAVAIVVPAAAALLGELVSRMWRTPAHRGVAGTLIGLAGEVRDGAAAGEPLRVLVAGALWQAEADEPLRAGERVIVTAQEDLRLRVAAATRAEKE